MNRNNSNSIENGMIDSYKGEYYDLFKSIFDSAENGICIVDYDGKIVELNNLYADMFGFEKEELIGEHYSIVISEDSQDVVERNHGKIFNGTNILKAEEKVKHKNGTFLYVQTTNLRVNDEYGQRLRITTAVDISSRLRNELVQSVLLKISNLTNLNTPHDELFASIHQAVCQLLPIKNFAVCVNNKITNKLEFPFSISEIGIDDEALLEVEHNYIKRIGESTIINSESIKALIDNNELNSTDIYPTSILGIPLALQNDILGSLIIKDYSGKQYSKEDKELLELVAGQVGRVIERKNYEDELVYSRNKAEEAVKIKSEFLAQISHEIRTPLNSILSFSSLIKDELNGTLTPELEETFNYIERGGNRLTRTIDLILNVSKSQNNQYQIQLEEIDLTKELFDPLVGELKGNAEAKGIELKFENPKQMIRLVCDQYSVNQLFANLIENAIKYTHVGSVTIKTFTNEFGKIQVDVKDTGIGMAEKYLPSLFEPFSQEEQGYTRSYEGIGLGLSLVRSYADLNNAEIKVKSEKDRGSLFSVIFN
jgi:PAS domain S-box-containing protein